MDKMTQKLIATFLIGVAGITAMIAEAFQQLFASVGFAEITRNVTTVAQDPGQQMILNLGVIYFKMFYVFPHIILTEFIFGAVVLAICFVWQTEINQALIKLKTMKISFSEEKKE